MDDSYLADPRLITFGGIIGTRRQGDAADQSGGAAGQSEVRPG